MDVCRRELPHAGLLAQDGVDEVVQLVTASALPVFTTDRAIEGMGEPPGRVSIPIADDSAYATYHVACLEQDSRRHIDLVDAIAHGWRR